MNTILKISWRNIWRSRTRSLVVIAAIIVGVWSVIFLSGFSMGMGKSYVESAIQNQTSHLQVHHPKFRDDKEVQYTLSKPEALLASIQQEPRVGAATLRTVVSGMVASSRAVRGVEIRGIDSALEAKVTQLPGKLYEGEYLNPDRKTGILISTTLAEKLKVKLRKKITLRFQDADNNLIDGAFRVVGLFNTNNSLFDESTVFVQRSQLNKLLNMPEAAHEAAILLNDLDELDPAASALKTAIPNEKVESYKEISPDIELFNTQIQLSSSIFTFIV
ncbi:MAG: ABC transporter permease, partial [Bacteroidota bacterium]